MGVGMGMVQTLVGFAALVCVFKKTSSDSLSTWLQDGSCCVYRTNGKHKALREDV